MNLPDWATFVTVDINGVIRCWEGEPMWEKGHWTTSHHLQRWDYLEELPKWASRRAVFSLERENEP